MTSRRIHVRIPSLACLLLAGATAGAPAARAAVNLEAVSVRSDRTTYGATDRAELVLSYRTTGTEALLRDIRVAVEVRGASAGRLTFRLREAEVPQQLHEFVMPVDLSRMALAAGTYTFVATLDADDAIAESDEGDNDARITLTIARAGAGAPSGATSVPSASMARRLRATSARAVSSSTCSALQREWTTPLEVGWHPGYGSAVAALRFDHPARDLRAGDRLSRVRLLMTAQVEGDPFTALGPLEARVRTLPARDASCAPATERRVTLTAFRNEPSLDLSLIADDDRLPVECADRVEIVLAFPERTPSNEAATLLRIDPASLMLEADTTRR